MVTALKKEGKGIFRSGSLALFSLSYFLILLIPLAMSAVSYISAMNLTRAQAIETNSLMVQRLSDSLDKSIKEADQFVSTLTNLSALSSFMRTSETSRDDTVLSMNRLVSSTVPSFTDSNELISRYYIYSARKDVILEPYKGYLDPLMYYDAFLSYNGMAYPQWRESILLGSDSLNTLLPAATALYTTSSVPTASRYLLYVRTYAVNNRNLGRIVFFLDEEKLVHMMGGYVSSPQEAILLLDGQGRVLTGTGVPESASLELKFPGASGSLEGVLDGTRMLMTYCRTRNGLTLVSAVPKSVFVSQAARIIRPQLLSQGFLMLLGVVLATVLLHSSRKPLLKTLQHLQIDERGGLWKLDEAVSQLTSSNSQLRERLEEQRVALRGALFTRLFSGDRADMEAITPALREMGVPLSDGYYRGIILRTFQGDQAGDGLRTLLIELLSASSPNLYFLSPLDRDHLLLLYVSDHTDPSGEEVTALLRQIYGTLQGDYRVSAAFYVGYEVRTHLCLTHSFVEAKRLEPGHSAETDWLQVAVRPQLGGYSYTLQDEQRLITQTRAGSLPGVQVLLDELLERNQDRALSPFQRQLLEYRMLDTLIQLGDQQPDVEFLQGLYGMGLEPFFRRLESCYERLCAQVQVSHQQKTDQLIDEVMAYIGEHYSEYELCLNTLALHFGVTEKYLSAFIKKKAGVGFSTYLEGLRIQRADELLGNPALTIEEIARQVGYANGKTFRRAYQRATGVLPSEKRTAGLRLEAPADAQAAPGGMR